MDLKTDENFELVVTTKNDLEVVTGYEEFKQSLINRLTLFQRDVIGDLNSPNAIRKVRSETADALNESDKIVSVEQLDISTTDQQEIEVYIAFNHDQTINETI